jgi:hypothetical protein
MYVEQAHLTPPAAAGQISSEGVCDAVSGVCVRLSGTPHILGLLLLLLPVTRLAGTARLGPLIDVCEFDHHRHGRNNPMASIASMLLPSILLCFAAAG